MTDNATTRLAPTTAGTPPRVSDSRFIAGTVLAGRYRILTLLGRGGMGEVYLAESTQGDFVQQVALKLLKRGMDSDEILRRFSQERRILAQLNHAHIAALVDGGVSAEGRPYYAMEYVAGEALTDYARHHGLGARERVQLMALICDASFAPYGWRAGAPARLRAHGRNLTLGSLGKPLGLADLRLGWIRAEPALIERLANLQWAVSMPPGGPAQRFAAGCLAPGA